MGVIWLHADKTFLRLATIEHPPDFAIFLLFWHPHQYVSRNLT
jgi:hypothetical protein